MSMNFNDHKETTGKKTISTNFKAGIANGRIVQIINMGNQHQTMWNPKLKQSQKLYWLPKEEQTDSKKQTVVENNNPVSGVVFKITVEFPKVRAVNDAGEDIGPAWLSKELGAKSKALAALAESFETDDLGDLIAAPVACGIAFTSGGKPKITTMLSVDEDTVVKPVQDESKLIIFDFYEPDMSVYEKLPEFMKEDMRKALDFPNSKLSTAIASRYVQDAEADAKSEQELVTEAGFDDDLPF